MFRALGKVWLAVFCILVAGPALANPLEVLIEPGEKPGVVQVGLTNTSTNPVSVLRWDTPFEDTLSHPVFIVQSSTKGGAYSTSATYTGRVVKRSAASEDSYIRIESGETLSVRVTLNEYYDIEQFGLYEVQFFGDIRYKELDGSSGRSQVSPQDVDALEYTHLHSNTMTMALQPNLTPRLRAPAYLSCSAQEQADIVEAVNIAETLTQTALTDLRSLTAAERASSPRYNTWFGAYDETRYIRVVSNFESIQNALAGETLQFDCNCNDAGTFAYVYPTLPFSITLCPEFRNAQPNGTNSRAGTIIHEISHFTVVADTDDHAYSHQDTQALAVSSPNLAVANADSHEYFAENDPALPIRRANDDPNPPQFSQLQIGTPVQSSVAAGEWNAYRVTNATRIALESLSGDADLYVYSDDQLSDEICRSVQTTEDAFSSDSTVDQCAVPNTADHYVLVRGYTNATYSIVANGNVPSNDDPTTSTSSGEGGGALGLFALLSLMLSLTKRARVRG
ncbi:MAG: M35 family metallo-endopeptidase [Granulosicoccus sp.]